MKLYEIAREIRDIDEQWDDNDVPTDAITTQFNALTLSFEQKVEAICGIIKETEADIDGLDGAISNLNAKRRSADQKVSWLRDYLKYGMEQAGIPKVKTLKFGVSLSDSQPKVEVKAVSEVPKEYVKTEIVNTVDKKAVLAHFKATGEIPSGVEITQGKTLRIT